MPNSIVPVYKEVNPWPASYCYLKPYYLDPNKSYFMQLADGEKSYSGIECYSALGQHGNLSALANQTHLVFPGAGWKIGERLTWSFDMEFGTTDGVREVVLKSRSKLSLGESTTEELASNYLKSG